MARRICLSAESKWVALVRRPSTSRSFCMCRATKIYLSYFFTLNTADLILGFLCGLLPGHTGHGIGYYEAKSAAAEGKGPGTYIGRVSLCFLTVCC